jgi:hypothetical protein
MELRVTVRGATVGAFDLHVMALEASAKADLVASWGFLSTHIPADGTVTVKGVVYNSRTVLIRSAIARNITAAWGMTIVRTYLTQKLPFTHVEELDGVSYSFGKLLECTINCPNGKEMLRHSWRIAILWYPPMAQLVINGSSLSVRERLQMALGCAPDDKPVYDWAANHSEVVEWPLTVLGSAVTLADAKAVADGSITAEAMSRKLRGLSK